MNSVLKKNVDYKSFNTIDTFFNINNKFKYYSEK